MQNSNSSKSLNKSKGNKSEELAAEKLEELGYKIIERNFSSGKKEVDIIARDGDWLVFVEVKSKVGTETGLPEEMITPLKIKNIKKVASDYLLYTESENVAVRFDVVAILYQDNLTTIDIFKDAFMW